MKLGIGIGIVALLASCGAEEVRPPPPLRNYCVELCPVPERGIGFERCAASTFVSEPCLPRFLDNGCRQEPRRQSAPPRDCSREGPTYCVQTCPQHAGECWVANQRCGADWVAGEGCTLATVQRTTMPRFDCVPDAGVSGDGGLDAGMADR